VSALPSLSPSAGGIAAPRRHTALDAWRARARRPLVPLLSGIVLLLAACELILPSPGRYVAAALAVTLVLLGAWVRDAPAAAAPAVAVHRASETAARRTAQALRWLEPQGWICLDHSETPLLRYDEQVTIGPGGAFLFRTHELPGRVEIVAGAPRHHREAGDGAGRALKGFEQGALEAAAELNRHFIDRVGTRIWLQAVVVLWTDFPQRVVELDRLVYVHGDAVADWLEQRPRFLSADAARRIVSGLRRD